MTHPLHPGGPAYGLNRASGTHATAAGHLRRLVERTLQLVHRLRSETLPLTVRLALYYAVFAGALVAAALGGSYWQLSSALRERAHTELRGEWQLVRHALAGVSEGDLADGNARAIATLRAEHPGLSIAVFSDGGATIVALGKEGDELAALARSGKSDDVTEFDWEDCLLALVAGPARTANGTPVRLAVGFDRTADRDLLAERSERLLIVSIASIFLIGALAGIVARRSLKPLRRLSDHVAALSATQLNLRMDERDIPRELQDFATAFNGLLENLDDAFNRLRTFSSDIAHELRSPLSNLVGKTQLTLSRARSASEYRAALEANAEELERMRSMVANMVFLAQAENAAAALQRHSIELRDVSSDIAEFYQVAAQEREIVIEVTGAAAVWADRRLVQRALGNLLSNAIRHTPDGATIGVRIVDRENEAIIEVKNPGRGIAHELQAHIFERFVRGDASLNDGDAAGGAGLGLAIVRSIMTLHGGAARVASQPEGPTVFSLHFPKRRSTND